MPTITAAEASRNFSALLDAVEHGDTVTITRGGHPVAEIGPACRRTGADLPAALFGIPAPGDGFADETAASVALLDSQHGESDMAVPSAR